MKLKENQTGEALRDKAYDVAYATDDLAGDVTDKAKEKAYELKAKGQSKYGDQIDIAADHVKNLTDQALPYVDKAKDFATTYVDKAHNSLDGLREKFSNEDIELTQDDLTLEEALQDLSEEAKEETQVATDIVTTTAKDAKDVVESKVDKVTNDVKNKIDDTKNLL